MLRVERGEVKALILFILSCRKRVWIKHRHAKRVGASCWNKWAGGGGGEWVIVFVQVFELLRKKGLWNFFFVEGQAIYVYLSIYTWRIDR